MAIVPIVLSVNGTEHELVVDTRTTLLEVHAALGMSTAHHVVDAIGASRSVEGWAIASTARSCALR